MATAPGEIPYPPPQEDLDDLYQEVLQGFASDSVPTAVNDSYYTTGDSVKNSERLNIPEDMASQAHTPPPQPLLQPDMLVRTASRPRRPLPLPPTSHVTASQQFPATDALEPPEFSPDLTPQPPFQHISSPDLAASSGEDVPSGDEEDEDEEEEDIDESRSDISESGQKMVPVPPYIARPQDDENAAVTLDIGPGVENLVQPFTIQRSLQPTSEQGPRTRYVGSSGRVISEIDGFKERPSDTGAPFDDDDLPISSPNESPTSNAISLNRRPSRTYSVVDPYQGGWDNPGFNPSQSYRPLSAVFHDDFELHRQEDLEDLTEEDELESEDDDDETRFINFSLLSHLAMLLRDKVPRGQLIKGGIPYPRAFTGKDIVSTIQAQISRELKEYHGASSNDRHAALLVARSLQSQLFFYEVEWGNRVVQDGVGDVYMFLDDTDGSSDAPIERAELPTGVITVLTKCYSPSCGELDDYCYVYSCPRKGLKQLPASPLPESSQQDQWPVSIPDEVLQSISENEINRQTIIRKLTTKEDQYIRDLDVVEKVFLQPLRGANPPIFNSIELEEFIEEVFGNIFQVRDISRRLLENLHIRQREQAPIIERIGDIFLVATTTDFKEAYPTYIGHHPVAERRLREELERNPKLRLFIESCVRNQSHRADQSPRLDLKYYLNRPVEHLQRYQVLLDAICKETDRENPDRGYLREAVTALVELQYLAQLHAFQETIKRGTSRKWEWFDLVTPAERRTFSRDEAKRQSIIFELIATEMAYVKDLEIIEKIYIIPLRDADPPIIPRDRLLQFLSEIFSNIREILLYHRRLVERLHQIQRDYHPRIKSISAAILDAVLNFREAYLEYIPNNPIAAYRIEEEMQNNPDFKEFHDRCMRHPDAGRLGLKHFLNRPIPRLSRYKVLLNEINKVTPPGHEDRISIPNVVEFITALEKDVEPGVASANQKVELWKLNSSIVFKPGESIDLDLLNDSRSLIHTGKMYRQPDTGRNQSSWTELFVILFDNYLIMTKPKEKDGVTRYHITRRPIPLELLGLGKFDDPPIQRPSSFKNVGAERQNENSTDSVHTRSDGSDNVALFPWTVEHTGRSDGPYVLHAESAAARLDWRKKLEETLGLRTVVQESNKVFEMKTVSEHTFLVPSIPTGTSGATGNDGTVFTGKVTCSVPFTTKDNRKLVAIGCAEGVWIGYLYDSQSMRRVLHLRLVTQCTILEEFNIFLVLADKTLFAYHLEALVPVTPNSVHASQTPQRLSGSKEVHFFSVGTQLGRTLVIYMRKQKSDSVFHVLEPISDKIEEPPKPSGGLTSRFGFQKPRVDWFKTFKEFSLRADSYDLLFLKARIVILSEKGFEIMDLLNLSSVIIPQADDPRLAHLSRRLGTCRPLGMFRVTDDEFILCYNEFGLYVNKHGDPSRRNGTVEWEGIAERVALHPPYLLLFDSRFIEVRHIETCRLAQIIPGNDVRCIWDGRQPDNLTSTIPAEGSDEDMSQEPRVHAVVNGPEQTIQHNGRATSAISQHVFELTPTIPLYIPEPIAPPSGALHYQPSSPPRSPPFHPITRSRRS